MHEDDKGGKSRSQKKRESSAVQSIGVTLTTLAESELRAMGAPETLIAAIADWKNFSRHEAKRRQMQYIGKLMRELNILELQDKLAEHLAPSREETHTLHAVEKLRDLIVNAKDVELEKKLAALVAAHPRLALPQLRHLALATREERTKKRPPKAYRELFRYLKQALARAVPDGPAT